MGVDCRQVYFEDLETIVRVSLEPLRRLLYVMEYGDQEDPRDNSALGHAGIAAGALLDQAKAQIVNAFGVVEDSIGRIRVQCRSTDTMGHGVEVLGVDFQPDAGGKTAAKAAAEGPARSGDKGELEYLAKTVWEYFEFLHEGFISTRTESLDPMSVRGLKHVLFDVEAQVNEMGKCPGLVQVRTAPPGPGAHAPELADYKEQAAEHGELPTAALALHDAFGFLDQVFISDKGGMDDASLDGLRRVLRSIHGQVGNLLNLAEAAHAQQAGPAGEAKPNRVVPFKSPAAPATAEPGPDQGPPTQAAANGLRFARDLDPEAPEQPKAPVPRRGILWWLNPRNWTK